MRDGVNKACTAAEDSLVMNTQFVEPMPTRGLELSDVLGLPWVLGNLRNPDDPTSRTPGPV